MGVNSKLTLAPPKNSMTKQTEEKKETKAKVKDYSKIYDKEKKYSFTEALKIIRELNKVKFDPSLELHFRLGIDPKKSDQLVRGAITLPHGTGKLLRIAAFVSSGNEEAAKKAGADLLGGQELIDEIKKSSKTDFDIAVAEPLMMKNLAPIAKILGTRGLMPSPKNETVSMDIAKTISELKKGKISFKNDDTANLHIVIGKLSFTDTNLTENFEALLSAVKKSRPASAKGEFIKSATLCSSMSPGVKLDL